MIKTVSKEKYTLLFEDDDEYIDCVAYETGKPMTVEEIGECIRMSRMSVSRYLKTSLSKIYYKLRSKNDISPTEIVCSMALAFNLQSIEEYRSFLYLLPDEIRSEVNEEARRKAA